VPDDDLALADGAIAPWGGFRSRYFDRILESLSEEYGFDPHTPWKKLGKKARQVVLHGTGAKEVPVRYRKPVRTPAVVHHPLRGRRALAGAPPHRGGERPGPRADRGLHAGGAVPRVRWCAPATGVPRGHGQRRNIFEVGEMSIRQCSEFFNSLELSERDRMIADAVSKEVNDRLRFLLDVGLDYLNLNRASGTLAGGEAQRIRLASQVGSGLVGVLYVLDEPSIGCTSVTTSG